VFSLAKTSTRQREILEIVLSNGWDYMRGLLTGSKTDEPKLPPPDVFRKILVELGPFYVKFGQLLSTRPDLLPPEYIQSLTALQAQVPTIAWTEIEPTIRQELAKPLEETFSKIETEPIAAGSIAQIYRATLISGEELAIKVQRPNISSIVSKDIVLIKGIAELVSLTEFGQNYDVLSLAEEFTNAVRSELDFTQEGSYTEQLRRNLSKSSWFDTQKLVVPKIYWEITTEKLLAIEWLDGQPILDAQIALSTIDGDLGENRRQLSTLLFRAFFQQFYLDGFFHADPHPGNIFYLQDNRIAIIDCGMVGRLDPRTQQLLTEMLLAIVDMDAARCAQLTLKLSDSTRAIELARLEGDFDRMLRKYYNFNLAELNFSEVFYEILQIARNNKIKLPRNLGLFTKSLANLEGVARKFDPQFNLVAEVKPLITDLFSRQLVGSNPLPTFLRTVLDLKSLSLQSARQVESLLDRLSSETLQFNLNIKEIDSLRRSMDDSANRLSFSILVGSLIMGAAIISTGVSTNQLSLVSNILFAAASFLGLWLIISILRSGRLK
jgi:ubiquinone biosynthesis protein